MQSALDEDRVAWVSTHVIPFEAEMRTRLRRLCRNPAEADDLIQDIYFRLLKAESVEHVREPRAFVMQIAKNLIIDRARRESLVQVEPASDIEYLADAQPSQERVVMARNELQWVLGLIGRLPERCRLVFRARRIYGMSQNETAQCLQVSENIIEKETIRGLKLLADMIARSGVNQAEQLQQNMEGASVAKKPNV